MSERRRWACTLCHKMESWKAPCGIYGEDCGDWYVLESAVDAQCAERNDWIKRFNRLEAAVSRHIAAKAWTDDADDALHSAHKRILKAASGSEGET